MTTSDEVAPGVSTNSPKDIPKARAMRKATASVGLAWLRSTWLNIDRLTSEAFARASNDHPRSARSCFNRRANWLPVGSDGMAAWLGLAFAFAEGGVIKCLIYRT